MINRAYKAIFLTLTKYSLPSLFDRNNITDFIDAYKEAYNNLKITTNTLKIKHFSK